MPKTDAPADVETGVFYPIREVSRITGVNSVTLRAWERRYGLIIPFRTGKGHRLYSGDHIALIKTITGWVDRGVPVGKVKALLHQELDNFNESSSDADVDLDEEWSKQRKEFIDAVRSFDEPHLDTLYSSALKLYPVEVVTERLVRPVIDLLSREWQSQGVMGMEQGFMYSYFRIAVGSRIYHASQRNQGPLILCANCLEDENELYSWLQALSVCESAGRARLLPAGMSLYDIGITAIRSKCDAVLLSSDKALHRETLERELPRLARILRRPVAISGQSTSIHREELKYIDINALGNNPGCSARELLGDCKI
ncbi:MerR family transcriptional regulator [Sansalvadorimonas sp. 2012CJ34-2]|uniref:MerR family transcriptional regulator n=1 Tax=Parendozoicomonas callyspongiae TaxID=2942213 RepID=A0ABT0PCZ7_9GAMM|nr:MerR family transcriptional regulator [Sansalvadorimonas sp. 2012CJ34-2]MCL6268408.1 MerR family transcriptional regulator [Sansalvadorimonas sp. 2012CJ34-2]